MVNRPLIELIKAEKTILQRAEDRRVFMHSDFFRSITRSASFDFIRPGLHFDSNMGLQLITSKHIPENKILFVDGITAWKKEYQCDVIIKEEDFYKPEKTIIERMHDRMMNEWEKLALNGLHRERKDTEKMEYCKGKGTAFEALEKKEKELKGSLHVLQRRETEQQAALNETKNNIRIHQESLLDLSTTMEVLAAMDNRNSAMNEPPEASEPDGTEKTCEHGTPHGTYCGDCF